MRSRLSSIGDHAWPSGFSDGETCKVWYACGIHLCWREGKWDPDDSACVIKVKDGQA